MTRMRDCKRFLVLSLRGSSLDRNDNDLGHVYKRTHALALGIKA